jgi:hypothetical protein
MGTYYATSLPPLNGSATIGRTALSMHEPFSPNAGDDLLSLQLKRAKLRKFFFQMT